jgi:hypothetical protein
VDEAVVRRVLRLIQLADITHHDPQWASIRTQKDTQRGVHEYRAQVQHITRSGKVLYCEVMSCGQTQPCFIPICADAGYNVIAIYGLILVLSPDLPKTRENVARN